MPILLQILQRGAETTVGLMGAMTTGYADSRRRLNQLSRYGTPSFQSDWAESYRERQRFHKLLNQLKREGLIANEGKPRRALWQLTPKGLQRLPYALAKAKIPTPQYERKRDGTWKVVIYDVPERERGKRLWIRRALASLGFSFLQESVWTGTSAIPRAFLDDLREMRMIHYVQIFEVSKRGTIELVK